MTEHQRLLWLLSRPACAEVNQAMLEFTGVYYNTGEQNQDMTKVRQVCDWKDTLTVLQHLQERNPFSIPTQVCEAFPLESMPTPVSMLIQPWQLGTQY